MTFTQDIRKYIQELKNNDSSEIELLLDKVTESYHEIKSNMDKSLNYYFAIFIVYLVLKTFDIAQIEIIGITLNQTSSFSSLFLIASSYFFYRHSSLVVHKQYLFILYSELSMQSKRVFYKYMFHYFLIPNDIGLVEEIHEKKFNKPNLYSDLINTVLYSVGYFSVLVLFIMTIIDTSKIDLKEIHSYKMALFIISTCVSLVLVIASINNFRNYFRINKLQMKDITSNTGADIQHN